MNTVYLNTPARRALAKQLIDRAPDGHVASIGEETRSQEQNRKMWPMLKDIQRQVPDAHELTTDDIKLQFLNLLGVELRFLPCLESQGRFPVGLKSSTLSKEQFAALIELIYAYGAKHSVRWSDPAEREQRREAA
jgi:hypothetical protein